ncbi:MAG: pseudouridine synthase [Desulfopila sp.]
MNEPVRLHKYLAVCGIASRRKAEELIGSGQVSVNGQLVTTMGAKIVPERDTVTCAGQRVLPPRQYIYVLLNKPKGYVTTRADPQGRPVVTSLVADLGERLVPVGRLDLDTEGALLLTNDGDLAQKIQHPSNETSKTYEALLQGHPGQAKLNQLAEGILLEEKMTAPATIEVIKHLHRQTLVRITIHEGRKRQVRKMFELVGNPVISLKRVAYGRLHLGKLPSGQYKILNSKDLKKIFL